MPIASMIVTSTPDADARTLSTKLTAIDGIKLHHRQDDKYVLLAETPTQEHDTALWTALNEIEGVGKVELVYYNFEDLGAEVQ